MEVREIGILKSPRSIVRLDREDNRLSISSRKHRIGFFGGLYMVISVKGSEFTGWKLHLNASEYSSDRFVLLTSLIVFLYRTPVPPP